MRILIVEDEEALASGLKFNFEQEGYDVLLAGDGPTALTLYLTEGRPDCRSRRRSGTSFRTTGPPSRG